MLKIYNYDIVCQEIPEEITLAVNISGCPNHCPGCHSPWLGEDVGKDMTIGLLTSLIAPYASAITCFCFMGGDAEPTEIQYFASWMKATHPGIKTAWYSGRQAIPDGFDIKTLDYIKLGPYIEALGGLKSPTTNQVLYKVKPDGSLTKCQLFA